MIDETEKLIVGVRQTRKILQRGEAEEVFIALDADPGITGPIRLNCEDSGIPVNEVPTMSELGRLCSIEIGASVACRRK